MRITAPQSAAASAPSAGAGAGAEADSSGAATAADEQRPATPAEDPIATDRIEREIAAAFAARRAQAESYGAPFARLWIHASECVAGGKLLRPRLLLGAFDALTGHAPEPADPGDAGEQASPGNRTTDAETLKRPAPRRSREAALRVAAGVELLHYSFLLHDDVIDGDLLRRGRPNVIGAILHDGDPAAPGGEGPCRSADERRLHWARTNGILLGDLLLSAAYQVFAREDLPHDTRLRLLDLVDRTITESVAGEQADVGLSDGFIAPELSTVLEMSRLKTASYTFELPLRAAALLAGAAPAAENAVGEAGRHLGIAFQLQDDLLSTFGCEAEHGKDAFSDLREGKETAIIAYARMTSIWPALEAGYGNPSLSIAEARAMRDSLAECGAEGFMRSLVQEQTQAAIDLLATQRAAIPDALARYLIELAGSLEGRRA
ncbi:polyprenyl synthetase family protein [Leucobacter massiliensis]|uniref:Geranylgeranyl pyrophosphate synthase n=1 Tax=Leucobacter massiliensis TaxID=1686285 RepID=A0A2S9QP39_9MICO|nr:polyprenyl synthetase family protein [Leucobacter massiliensis]PRI11357.1 hypothetical protein B4915_09030 [Leucobacter massiliensis]